MPSRSTGLTPTTTFILGYLTCFAFLRYHTFLLPNLSLHPSANAFVDMQAGDKPADKPFTELGMLHGCIDANMFGQYYKITDALGEAGRQIKSHGIVCVVVPNPAKPLACSVHAMYPSHKEAAGALGRVIVKHKLHEYIKSLKGQNKVEKPTLREAEHILPLIRKNVSNLNLAPLPDGLAGDPVGYLEGLVQDRNAVVQYTFFFDDAKGMLGLPLRSDRVLTYMMDFFW